MVFAASSQKERKSSGKRFGFVLLPSRRALSLARCDRFCVASHPGERVRGRAGSSREAEVGKITRPPVRFSFACFALFSAFHRAHDEHNTYWLECSSKAKDHFFFLGHFQGRSGGTEPSTGTGGAAADQRANKTERVFRSFFCCYTGFCVSAKTVP